MGKILGTFAKTYDKFVRRSSLLPTGLSELVQSTGAKNIVEFACGTGTVAVGLALDKYRVIGIDYSRDMLRAARRKALQYGADVRFVHADITKVDLGRKFDLLLCLGNTIPHFTSRKTLYQMLANAKYHLRPGGYFIFQQLNYDRILMNRPTTFATDVEPDLIRIKQYRYRKNLLDFYVTLVDSSKIPPRIQISKVVLKPWLKDELNSALKEYGFVKIKAYGAYGKDKFTLKSKDLILMGQA